MVQLEGGCGSGVFGQSGARQCGTSGRVRTGYGSRCASKVAGQCGTGGGMRTGYGSGCALQTAKCLVQLDPPRTAVCAASCRACGHSPSMVLASRASQSRVESCWDKTEFEYQHTLERRRRVQSNPFQCGQEGGPRARQATKCTTTTTSQPALQRNTVLAAQLA